MPENVRLTRQEQEDLRRKATEMNKALIAKGKQPLKDSELLHKILAKAINRARLKTNGEIEIEDE